MCERNPTFLHLFRQTWIKYFPGKNPGKKKGKQDPHDKGDGDLIPKLQCLNYCFKVTDNLLWKKFGQKRENQ